MYYFLNDNLQLAQSGIEHAEIARLRLFAAHGVPAQLVTRQFSLTLPDVLVAAQLARRQVVNLFEFFCECDHAAQRSVTLADLSWPAAADLSKKDRQWRVTVADQLLAIVYLRADGEQVSNVQTFDSTGRTVKMTWWDVRGVRRLVQLFDGDGQIAQEQYLDSAGRVRLIKAHLLTRANRERVSWRLIDARGCSRTFAGLNDLTRYFYDCLNRQESHNVFICDRTVECDWALFHMRTAAKKVLHLHNDHVSDPRDMLHSPLNNNYQNALVNWDQWDAVITATVAQQHDVVARFGSAIPTFAIPVGYVAAPMDPHRRLHRQAGLIVQVARVAAEKQPSHTVAAFARVYHQVPTARLEFWGYANGDTEQRVRQQVADLGLEGVVRFCGYTSDVGAVYDRAQLGVLPSRAEGFSLMLLEAQAHGLPMVANDVKYGPAEIIQDQRSGWLTQNGDIAGLAHAMTTLLTDDARREAYSQAAYQAAQRYSAERVWTAWQPLLTRFAADK